MSDSIDPVALEHRLTKMEASIQASGQETRTAMEAHSHEMQDALGTVTTAVEGLTMQVGRQNGRVGKLEAAEAQVAQLHIRQEAREQGRVEVKKRHVGYATTALGIVIVASQAVAQAFG